MTETTLTKFEPRTGNYLPGHGVLGDMANALQAAGKEFHYVSATFTEPTDLMFIPRPVLTEDGYTTVQTPHSYMPANRETVQVLLVDEFHRAAPGLHDLLTGYALDLNAAREVFPKLESILFL